MPPIISLYLATAVGQDIAVWVASLFLLVVSMVSDGS